MGWATSPTQHPPPPVPALGFVCEELGDLSHGGERRCHHAPITSSPQRDLAMFFPLTGLKPSVGGGGSLPGVRCWGAEVSR